MAHDLSSDEPLDMRLVAYVAEKSLLALQLDAAARRAAAPEDAQRLHATADQARVLADIEIGLCQLRRVDNTNKA